MPVPGPLGWARVPQCRRKDIAEKVTTALATGMEGRAGVAGDRNIPRGLRIPVVGWIRSADLQEPREERAALHSTTLLHLLSPQEAAPEPSFYSSLSDKRMTLVLLAPGAPSPHPSAWYLGRPIGSPTTFTKQNLQSKKRRRFWVDPPESE